MRRRTFATLTLAAAAPPFLAAGCTLDRFTGKAAMQPPEPSQSDIFDTTARFVPPDGDETPVT